MNFDWSEASTDLCDRALEFSRQRLGRPGSTSSDWREAGAFGLLGLSLPSNLQGLGLGALETARVLEAVGKGLPSLGFGFAMAAHLFACAMPLAKFGANWVLDELVPRLADGQLVGANAITESEAGSDVYAMRTRAVLDGDEYVLTGEKSFVTNAPQADIFLVYASTEPSSRHLGISAFVVPRDASGVVVGRNFEMRGLRGASMAPLHLDGCRIPARALIGRPGGGAQVFEYSMAWERACLFGLYVGAMERVIERCVERVQGRRVGGGPIARHQAVAHRLVAMQTKLETSRLLLHKSCWLMDQGRAAGLEGALAKLCVSEAAVEVGLDAIQLFGAEGCIAEIGVDELLLDALPSRVFSGTSDIQRNLAFDELIRRGTRPSLVER